MSRSQLTKQDIIRLLPVNQLLYTRTAPTNPVVERTQKRSYSDGGGGAAFGPGSHAITTLQTGTDFIDPLQSFVQFDIVALGTGTTFKPVGSILNIIRDTQISTRSGKEMARITHANWLNYHRVRMAERSTQAQNLNGLMLAQYAYAAPEIALKGERVGLADGVLQKVMVPLKWLSGIFDSDKLMPPHLARGLRVDLTLESAVRSFVCDAKSADASYAITNLSILTDNYRMADSVLEFLNAEFASKDSGLVYEYTSWHTTTQSLNSSALAIEVRRSVSMALDAFCVTRLAENKDAGDESLLDSFASIVISDADESQWRIGAHYLPNRPSVGVVEHYAQCLYWANKLRHDQDAGIYFNEFKTGTGKFCTTLQRNAILDLSGIAINNSMTLSVNGTLAAGGDRDAAVFLRHLRRAVCFLESVQLET